MTRYWLSWEEPGDDPRPFTVPSPDYWVTGWGNAGEDNQYATVCAIVDAHDIGSAQAKVREFWAAPRWRFGEARPDGWQPPADRFPPR